MQTELYWINGPWKGCLAIMPRPRGGDWLEGEISSWQRLRINTVVSALTKEEIAELDLEKERELAEKAGIVLIPFPITDRGIPSSMNEVLTLIRPLEKKLQQGENVAIHCRQGIGRAALLAACVLAASGMDPVLALEQIRIARGRPIPDTNEQEQWIVRFAREMLGEPAQKIDDGIAFMKAPSA